jgi:hypothetical protein
MPNPPKPTELKRKLGNPGKQKLPETAKVIALPAIDQAPEPHRQLFDAGLTLWNNVWALGQTWISKNTDAELLLMTCEMIDERVRLRALVWNNPEAWRERKALRELDKCITANLSLLGFTPVDRTRMGVAEVRRQSKIEELRNRVETRNQ